MQLNVAKHKRWIALFSQTGGELASIMKLTGCYPNQIIVNRDGLTQVDDICTPLRTSTQPRVEDYLEWFDQSDIVTLHGWLRIIPPPACVYNIYNGHPGLIGEFPQLKGKDPQAKAVRLGLPYSGAVIHKVTSAVDEGEIVRVSEQVPISGLTVEEVVSKLKQVSILLWVDFLKTEGVV